MMHQRFTLILTPEEKQALQDLADAKGLKLGDLIRDACRLLLDWEEVKIPDYLFKRPRDDKRKEGGE